jgi:hypothetical protein
MGKEQMQLEPLTASVDLIMIELNVPQANGFQPDRSYIPHK